MNTLSLTKKPCLKLPFLPAMLQRVEVGVHSIAGQPEVALVRASMTSWGY